ncbi:helix-turn-helix domain-containing protein [Streptomyces sp. S186]|uniref:helix-turn-helix domain-containing protein n=1 Tax=Streptomyces sp. S186 TaxID=3434395 RepID=UPI003F676D60
MNTCTQPGCDRRHYALGLCQRDYLRQRKHDNPAAAYRPYELQKSDVDEAAVRRLMVGDPPASYTRPERAEAVRQLHRVGLTDNQVAARLRVERITVWRVRTRMGLPINRERMRRAVGAGSPNYLLPHPWLTASVNDARRRTAS